jgi:hypothetical protein
MANPINHLAEAMAKFANETASKVREINKRYEHPKIHMTPLVKFSLLALRLYLLLLVLILFYKFYTLVR